ncbi:MAG: hypothetical protein R6U28_04675 [Cyclonatronaceae bacterium]
MSSRQEEIRAKAYRHKVSRGEPDLHDVESTGRSPRQSVSAEGETGESESTTGGPCERNFS